MLNSRIGVVLDGEERTFFLDTLLREIGIGMPVVTVCDERKRPLVDGVLVGRGLTLAEVERDVIGQTIEMIEEAKRLLVRKVTESEGYEEAQLKVAYLRLLSLARPALKYLVELGGALTRELAKRDGRSSIELTPARMEEMHSTLCALLAETGQDNEDGVLVS